eukprot:SAG11_NODE_9584_length_898_cov_1.680851_1_plen_46_part_10
MNGHATSTPSKVARRWTSLRLRPRPFHPRPSDSVPSDFGTGETVQV